MTPMRRALASLGVLVLVLIGLNAFVHRVGGAWDLTAEGSGTLSPATLRVLDEVGSRIQITAFFTRDAPGRAEAATLLSRYRDANRKVTFRIVDPSRDPGEAQRLGATHVGMAVVQELADPDEIETVQYTIEIDVTSAIARLLRDVEATVCFTSGHGERDLAAQDPEGLSDAAEALRSNGYKTRTIDLLASPTRPKGCDAVVVAAPTRGLSEGAASAITAYLKRSGKVLLLADPRAEADLSAISGQWGIAFDRGIVIEGDANSILGDDVTAPIVRRYSGASSVVRGLSDTYFPGVMRVTIKKTDDPGLTVAEVASTSELSYLDRENAGEFDPKSDQPGPITIGAIADDSEVSSPGTEDARVLRTRILAWGDVDFASNHFFGDAANAQLFVQGIDWLTQPEDLVTAVPQFPKLRNLELTAARSRYMLLLMAGVIPGLFVIGGAFVWLLRRGR